MLKNTRCTCGAGIRKTKAGITLAPHSPDCRLLHEIAKLERRGICATCGSKKKRQKAWDQHMQLVVTRSDCPNGHSVNMSWRRPTKSDIRYFGLKVVRAK